jgi:hypothetical protein
MLRIAAKHLDTAETTRSATMPERSTNVELRCLAKRIAAGLSAARYRAAAAQSRSRRRGVSPNAATEKEIGMSAGTDKERVNELTARTVSYQSKVPADWLEGVNAGRAEKDHRR